MSLRGRNAIIRRDMRMRGYKLMYDSKRKMFMFYSRAPRKLAMLLKSAWEWDRLRYLYEFLWTKKCIDNRVIPIYGIVDGEGDITYYKLMSQIFRGINSDINIMKDCGIEGRFEDKWFIVEKGDIERLKKHHYGDDKGEFYILSLPEAYHLYRRGVLKLNSIQKDFLKDDFVTMTGEVFSYMRSRGIVVKTGFKYGCHYRAYENDPENTHAEYLIQCVQPRHADMWEVVSRAVRVAHGVRKEMVYAIVPKRGGLKFLKIERTKM